MLIDAWAAGIVDGEGCITIKRRSVPSPKRYYSLFVVVGQSGKKLPAMLRQLLDVYGGGVEGPYQCKRANRQPRWSWYVAHGQAESFLRRVLPFLIQKCDQAEVALAFRETALGRGHTQLQQRFFHRLQKMKPRRGRDD